MSVLPTITVKSSISPRKEPKAHGRPAHHCNDTQTLFTNPWNSFDAPNFHLGTFGLKVVKQARAEWKSSDPTPKDEYVKIQTPDWGLTSNPETWSDQIKATWMGHACFLVELPAPPNSTPSKDIKTPGRGPRILFDPVFSNRCSPSQWIGPVRQTPPPLSLGDLPHVDVVILSHNHYDHTDVDTLKHIYATQPKGSVHFFCGLGNLKWFQSIGFNKEHVTELDWWYARDATITIPNQLQKSELTITCLPCQHFTGRTFWDRFETLWASWAIEQKPYSSSNANLESPAIAKAISKVWFGGDTGLRNIPIGAKQEVVPMCPVFKQIGERFGGFDLALIPIGAYSPRNLFSSIHASPDDAVEIHLQIKSRRSIGMHWGCWMLGDEPFMRDPQRLRKACEERGVNVEEFNTVYIGETLMQTVESVEEVMV